MKFLLIHVKIDVELFNEIHKYWQNHHEDFKSFDDCLLSLANGSLQRERMKKFSSSP